MKLIGIVLLACSVGCFAQAADTTPIAPAKAVDWSKLNPAIIELALDGIDAVDRLAEVVDARQATYAPREDETEKIFQKMRRMIDSPADRTVYEDATVFYFSVQMCRITYTADRCGPLVLGAQRNKATADVKADKAKFQQAQKQ